MGGERPPPFAIVTITYEVARYQYAPAEWAVGTSDFDAQMSSIQIQKGNEILRPVYKKTIFRNIEWLLPFWAISS